MHSKNKKRKETNATINTIKRVLIIYAIEPSSKSCSVHDLHNVFPQAIKLLSTVKTHPHNEM